MCYIAFAMNQSLRSLPSVDKLLSDERIHYLEEEYSHEFVLRGVRQYLEEVRHHIAEGQTAPTFNEIVGSICSRIASLAEPSLRPVINATGVLLHTNLGRAPLSREAMAAMEQCAKG